MTYTEREAIFAKEVLEIEDIMALYGMCKSQASEFMRGLKEKVSVKNGALRDYRGGKLHVQDYLDGLKIPYNSPRYSFDGRRAIKEEG